MQIKHEEIKFPVDVELGKFYKVPCVRTLDNNFCPINSYLHEDKKIIGASFYHWHIDWRFATNQLWIEVVMHWCRPHHHTHIKGNQGIREVAVPVVYLPVVDSCEYRYNTTSKDQTIYYKRLKCKRPYSASRFFIDDIKPDNNWVPKMQKFFSGSKLKETNGQLICPHKGVTIDKNCKDHEGNYVCPAHLLRFDPVTLKCI